ncbi:sigma 54-interacting transcriptional regulator [Bacillus sp. SL00103]
MKACFWYTKKELFTGATDQPGLFEQAQGGTLLLDEINSQVSSSKTTARLTGETREKAWQRQRKSLLM